MADNAFTRFGNRLFDPGTLSDQNVQQNRNMANALLNQVSQPQNIQSPTQGLALLAQALNAQAFRQKANRGETALKEQKAQQMGALLNSLNLNPDQQALVTNLPNNIQQDVLSESAMRSLFPEKEKLEVPKAFNFLNQRTGRLQGTFLEGSPEYLAAIKDPDLFIAGNASQVQRQEQGGPGDFDPRTKAQLGKDTQAFMDMGIAAVSGIQTAGELIKITQQDPAAMGLPGTFVRIGDELFSTTRALADLAGFDLGPTPDLDDFDYSKFESTAINNSQFRSGILSIAYSAVVAEQGSRPSDTDVQNKIDELAGSSSNPVAFGRTIQGYIRRLDRRIRTTARIKNIDGDVRDRVFSEMDSALGGFNELFKANDLTPEEMAELEMRRKRVIQ